MKWVLASYDDLPDSFHDKRCDDFRTICSNGFEVDISIGSAFLHKPSRWPQCFPNGAEEAVCTSACVRRAID